MIVSTSEMPGESVVELLIEDDNANLNNRVLKIGFTIPAGYELNIETKTIEILNSSSECPVILDVEKGWGKYLATGRGFTWKISDRIVGGEKYYETMVSFSMKDFNEFEVKFPEYYLNGKVFQIPLTTFKRKEGTFLFPLLGGL